MLFLRYLGYVLGIVVYTSLASASVYISEVFWIGSEYSTADEWIELQVKPNFTGSIVSLAGLKLITQNSKGEQVTIVEFESGTLLYAATPFIISNYSAADSVLAIEPDIVTSKVSLLNSELQLQLVNASGAVIDQAGNGVGTPFAGGKSGEPPVYISMQRAVPLSDGSASESWFDSAQVHNIDSGALVQATPGAQYNFSVSSSSVNSSSTAESSSSSSQSNISSMLSESSESSSLESSFSSSLSSSELATILLNEILPNPIGSDDFEWIELFVPSSGAVLLSGFTLTDESSKVVDVEEVMQAHTGVTIYSTESGTFIMLTKEATGLALNNSSDSVILSYSGAIIDQITYSDLPENVSIGRLNATGSFVPLCTPSPAANNTEFPIELQPMVQATNGIVTESGTILGTGSLAINLQITQSGSTAPLQCITQFTDGFSSTSCNPPNHTIAQVGTGLVRVSVQNFCGTTAEHSINYIVTHKEISSNSTHRNSTVSHSTLECAPSHFSGIELSEVMPNPRGNETYGEWVELQNTTNAFVLLCGWQLDDAKEGSKPFFLNEIVIAPKAYITIGREESKIAFNNSKETVRLLAPTSAKGTTEPKVIDEVYFETSNEGESLAKRNDGNWLWTRHVTPKASNVFAGSFRNYADGIVVVSAALPNPEGNDAPSTEWIEIHNTLDGPQNLQGWQLRTTDDRVYTFADSTLKPYQKRRLYSKTTGLALANKTGQVQLLDPDGYINGVLQWNNAKEAEIYRFESILGNSVQAKVLEVLSATTLKIGFIDPDQLRLLPPSVKRAWLASAESAEPHVVVSLLGIQSPNHIHATSVVQQYGQKAVNYTRNAMQGKLIDVVFDQELWNVEQQALAYVFIENQTLQAQLLQHGLAYADDRFACVQCNLYNALEKEAIEQKLGMWANAEFFVVAESEKLRVQEDWKAYTSGIEVHPQIPTGRYASGTLIQANPNVLSDVYIAVNSGAFIKQASGITLQQDSNVQWYAERTFVTQTGSYTVKSAMYTGVYLLEQFEYNSNVRITEVFPAPKANTKEQEWIELTNFEDTAVALGGWILDDVLDGGSRPYTIPFEVVLQPRQSVIFTKDQTGLALNNSNEQVWLLAPNGTKHSGIAYKSSVKGKSLVYDSESTLQSTESVNSTDCISDVPTPNKLEKCVQLGDPELLPDTDNDGVPDDYEMLLYNSNPNFADTDGDGWYDGFEVFAITDVLLPTEHTRELKLLYKKFIQKKLQPKFTMLKTKPSRLEIGTKGIRTIAIESDEFAMQLTGSGERLQVELPALSIGEHIIHLYITDVAGHQTTLSYTVVMPARAVRSSKIRSLALPAWAKFKQLFVVNTQGELLPNVLNDSPIKQNIITTLPINSTSNVKNWMQNGVILILLTIAFCVGTVAYLRKK